MALLLILVSCAAPKSEWKGSMREIDGVTVVRNPLDPIHDEGVILFEADIRIESDEENETYLFNRIEHITVDREGRIYVLDRDEGHVLVFDADGGYMRTISRKGQGPEELNNPYFIYIADGELMVLQFERISFFSPNGEFRRTIPTARERLRRVRMNSRGGFVATSMLFDSESIALQLKLYDFRCSPIRTIKEIPIDRTRRIFAPAMYMTVMEDDFIVFGYSADYELQVFSPEGNPVRRITRKYRPVEITREEISERTGTIPPDIQYEIPEHHPAFARFIHDEQGRLYVQTMEKCPGFQTYLYDVFDPEGRFLTRTPLRQYPVLFRGGRLYSLEEDEKGFPVIRRYLVRWTI